MELPYQLSGKNCFLIIIGAMIGRLDFCLFGAEAGMASLRLAETTKAKGNQWTFWPLTSDLGQPLGILCEAL